MVRVMTTGSQPHAPRAGDGYPPGIPGAEGIGACTQAFEVALRHLLDRAEQCADRRPGELAGVERQLASAAHGLLEWMRLEAMQSFEIGRQLREECLEAGPAARRRNAFGVDEGRIVVDGSIAGVAQQPPCGRP